MTRRGAVVRSDTLDDLTECGWSRLWAFGVRTIIDLRNDSERAPDVVRRPSGIDTLCLPLDAREDREFWDVWENGPQFGTPLYYRPHLERFPERTARVLSAIAHAQPGGVVINCGGGRDRAGQVTMVLLRLFGVDPAEIARDYSRSHARLRRRYAAFGEPDQGLMLEAFLTEQGTTAEAVLRETVTALDLEDLMERGGLRASSLELLRRRALMKRTR